MKKQQLTVLLLLFLPIFALAQSPKKKSKNSILAATNFNFYTPLKSYQFTKEYFRTYDDLILKYITKDAGTFTVEDGDSTIITRTLNRRMPSQLIGLGASLQFRNLKGLFHELSITKLSYYKTDHTLTYTAVDSNGDKKHLAYGFNEKMLAFAFRYELGKYFGRNKNAALRFGLSGGIEQSFYRFKPRPNNFSDSPLEAKLYTIDLALIPMLSAKVSKYLSLDFKVIPNFLTADFGTLRQEDPSFTVRQQGGFRNYKSPDMTWAFSIQMRYMIKEAKKRRKDD
ncbi:MAG: hypothetical protein IT258_14680 [Saprospiraceae bacterium]|nr:hypothetical protein [Saprospiraceae bacterium]